MLPAERVVNDLKAFDARGTHALTLYLATDPSREAGANLDAQLADLLRPVEERLVGLPSLRQGLDADVAAVRKYMAGLLVLPRGLALFSCQARGFFRALPSAVRFRPGVSWGEHFDLRSLVTTVAEHGRVLVVLLDKEKARFFRVVLEEIEEFEELWDYVPRKQRQAEYGGDAHLQREHEMHVLAHLRHTVDALTRLDAREPVRRVLVGGPAEVMGAFMKLLPKHMRTRVHPAIHVPVCSTPARVLEVVRDVNRTLERDSEERLVAEVLSESAGHAALGVQAVVEAVNEKRARTLVLAERAHLPGGECGRCAVIFADPVPSICPACGEPLEWLPDILPVLAEAVLRQDGQVLELHDAAGRTLLTHGGVATRLRYARPARLSA